MLTPFVLSFSLGAAPAPRAVAPILDLAVTEIDSCCQGVVEEADWDAERRWAQALYRFVVLGAEPEDFARLSHADRLSMQALRLDAAYVTAVAVHPREWLELYWDHLPRARAALACPDLRRFAEAVKVLGIVEQELQDEFEEHQRKTREVGRRYADHAGETVAARDATRRLLAESWSGGPAADLERIFAPRRQEIETAIARRQTLIRSVQEKFWEYQKRWSETSVGLKAGSPRFLSEMVAYQATANQFNQRILALGREVTELRHQQERYRSGPKPEDLDRLARPPAARPVLP